MKEMVIDGNETFDFIAQLLSVKDIEDVEFRNCNLLKEELLQIINFKKYERIAFIDCQFEEETLIKNIQTNSLSLNNNKINNYDFIYEMNNLQSLTIVNGHIDAYKLNSFLNLEYLRVSQSNILNIESLYLKKLKYLFVDNTNITSLSFVQNFPNLKLLSISEEQRINNLETLKSISHQVKIILDSIIEMEINPND